MKKKIFISLLLAVLLCLGLSTSAFSLWDYGMIYDGTELLDGSMLDSYGRTVLPGFKSTYGVELRVDIITESSNAEQTAKTYFDSFLYASDTNGNGAVLTLCVTAADGNISFVDGCVYAAGEQWLIDAAETVEAELSEYLSAAAWDGSISQDSSACEAMLKAYYEGMSEAAQAQGASGEAADSAGSYATYSGNPQAELGFVTDEAGILTEQQRVELEALAAGISAEKECGVYMVIVNDYTYYSAGSIEDFAESIFTEYHMGWGDEQDGVVLVLSMAERDYDLLAHGSKGNGAFTDYGKEALSEEFLDNFRNDDWGGGFSDYVETAQFMLQRYEEGRPVDVNDRERESGVSFAKLLIVFGLPCLIAFVVCELLRAQLRTATKRTNASGYIAEDGLNLRIKSDYFTNRRESREVIKSSSSSSHGGFGGGGGTSVNSRGFSHRSGKF